VDTGSIAQHGALSGVWLKQGLGGDVEFMALDSFRGNCAVAHRHCPGFTPSPAFRSAPL